MHLASKRRYSVMVTDETPNPARGVGLCSNCRFMRQLTSDRGSIFYQCQLSATDPDFPKYPRLPVIRCRGYEPMSASEAADRQLR